MAKIAKVQEVDVVRLKPYERNAKIHGADQIEKLRKSIEEFGFISPCLIDNDYNVIAGHGRIMAAQEMGLKKVPCLFVEGLTDEQRRAYILADNRLTELGEWDMGLVEEEFKLLLDDNFDATITGFDFQDEYAAQNVQEDEYGARIEQFEEEIIQADPTAKMGQIYKLGNHRLMCGDSTNAKDVEKLVNGATIDLLLTDPPYNVDVGRCERPFSSNDGVHIMNDNMSEEAFISFLTNALAQAEIHMKQGGAFYIWYAGLHHSEFDAAVKNIDEFKISEQLIWVKSHFVMGRNSDYQWAHECCLYGWKTGAAHYFIDSRSESTVIEDRGAKLSTLKKDELIALVERYRGVNKSSTVMIAEKPASADLHPTVKPQSLLVEMIKNSSRRGENVLDLFGGSGSTMLACEQMGRNCFIMELDPHYVDVIIKRWEDFTGEKAVLING